MSVSASSRAAQRFLVLAIVLPSVALASACSSNSKSAAPPASTTGVPSGSTSTVATPTIQSTAGTSTPPASDQACLFGAWNVISPPPYSASSWDIRSSGSIVVDYHGELDGLATFDTTLPANPQGSTGSYVATPVSQNVTSFGRKITLTAHNTMWTCHGNSLTLDVSPGGTFQLSRKSS